MISDSHADQWKKAERDRREKTEYLRLCLQHSDRKLSDGTPIDRQHADFDPRFHCPSCKGRMDDPVSGTYEEPPCGCRIVGNGTLPQPRRILHCAQHGGPA